MLRFILSGILLVSFSLSAYAKQLDTNGLIDKVYLAYDLEFTNPDSAYLLSTEVLQTSVDFDYQEGIAYASMRIGSILNTRGANDSAVYYIKRAYQIRKELNDYKGASSACIELSFIYRESGQEELAFNMMYESLRFSESSNDSVSIVNSLLELGVLYAFYKDSKAIDFFNKAMKIAKYINYQGGIANSYSQMGFYYFNESLFQEALDNFSKALLMFIGLDDEINMAKTYSNIGLCEMNLNRYLSAIKTYKKAEILYDKFDMIIDKAIMYNNIGDMYGNLDFADSAIYYLNKGLTLSKEKKDVRRQSESLEWISKAYTLKKNYQKAYEYHIIYSELKDSLLDQEKISAIAEMQTKYETEKKEQQIVLLDEQNKTQKAERNYILASSAVILLLLLISGLYYYQRSRIAIKNEKIAQQEVEALMDEQDIKTFNAMLEGQEEERMRIATDLHDRLGSMLSTVKLLFSSLEEKIDQAQEENRQQYDKASHLLDDACVEIRRISHNLGTGMVANFGLKRAIEELCESVDQSDKINCKALVYGIEKGIPLAIETGIYRMVQEGVNNAIKHAKADNLTVQLNKLEDSINVSIEDDGIGFNLQEQRQAEGMGLGNLEKRAQKLGGELHIDTQKGRGTTIIIDLPLNLQS